MGPVGVALTVVGFGLAYWQINEARKQTARLATATEAANLASERTARTLAQNQILVLIPDMERVLQDIHRAVGSDEAQATVQLLHHWRGVGIKLRGLLRAKGDVPEDVLTNMTKSFSAATTAIERIQSAHGTLVDSARPATRAIAKVIEEIGDLGGQILGQSETEGTS